MPIDCFGGFKIVEVSIGFYGARHQVNAPPSKFPNSRFQKTGNYPLFVFTHYMLFCYLALNSDRTIRLKLL